MGHYKVGYAILRVSPIKQAANDAVVRVVAIISGLRRPSITTSSIGIVSKRAFMAVVSCDMSLPSFTMSATKQST